MNDIMKWTLKVLFSAVVWVFLLSIRWNDRTMFSYAHATLVQNSVVAAIDEELSDLWTKVSRAVRTAVSGESERQGGGTEQKG